MTTSVDQLKQDIGNKQFLNEAQDLFLDLGSSAIDRMNFLTGKMQNGKLNEAQMMAVQELSQQRNALFSFLTNISRSVHDVVMSIIRNIGR